MKVPSTRRVLLVGYPIAAAVIGLVAWLLQGWFFPDEPNPPSNGIVVALVIAAYMYIRTWFDFRKARRERAKV